jgi:hypothetical protein
MPPKISQSEPHIGIAADLDPVAAADCRAGLLDAIARLPSGADVTLTLSAAGATVPSLQLFFAAHRSLTNAGHGIVLGLEGAAVLGASNLATISKG